MRTRVVVGIVFGLVGATLLVTRPWATSSQEPSHSRVDTAGSSAPVAGTGNPNQFPVTIRTPAPSPGVSTGLVDARGRLVTVSCQTCHSMLEPPLPASLGLESLKDFHRGLVLEHGNLTCLSCHHPTDARSFRLANETLVESWDVIELCSQCHGPQRADYDHGAHGGMSGYWDLSRGPRVRNSCTSCHSPHEPSFGPMQPTFKPIDRFLVKQDHHVGAAEHE